MKEFLSLYGVVNQTGIVFNSNPDKVITQLRKNNMYVDAILFELPTYNGQEDDLDGIWNGKNGFLEYNLELIDCVSQILPSGFITVCFKDHYSDFELTNNDFPAQIDTLYKQNQSAKYETYNVVLYAKNKVFTKDTLFPIREELSEIPAEFERFKLFYNIIKETCPENGVLFDLSSKDETARETAGHLNRKYIGVEENIWRFKNIEQKTI